MVFPDFFERGEVMLDGIEVERIRRQEEQRGPRVSLRVTYEGANLAALGLGSESAPMTFHPRESVFSRVQLSL